MQSDTKRRVCWAIAFFFLLILAALGAIVLVDASANAITDVAKRCAPSIWQSQWPIHIGCAIAAHDGLSGELIGAVVGAGVVLVAASLAYSGVQEQIAAERNAREMQQRDEDERRWQSQLNAKTVAVVCLTQPIRAAAALKFAMHRTIEGGPDKEARVKNALTHLEQTLASFTVAEAVRDLGVEDRATYLEIVGSLSTLLSIGRHGATSGTERHTVLQSALGKRFVELLEQFDHRLAQEITSSG